MVRRLRARASHRTNLVTRAKRFLGYTTLLAGLVAGCAGKVPNKPNPTPTVRPPAAKAKPAESECPIVGQKVWYGVTWRKMYGLKLVYVGKKSVRVNVEIPHALPTSTSAIETMQVRVNGLEIPRTRANKVFLFQAPCNESVKFSQPTQKRGVVRAKDDSKATSAKINRGHLINRVLTGIHDIFAAKAATSAMRTKPPVLLVMKKTQSEFLLRVKGGKHDGKSVRLDRRLTISIETVSRKVTVVEAPYRIDSLTSDGKGNLKLKLSLATK